MRTAWRIIPETHAAAPFTGEGARRFGGRWNSPGHPAVYSADSRALAVLEVLVHLHRPAAALRYRIFAVAFATAQVEVVTDAALLADTASPFILQSTQRFGDAWLRENRSPVLQVPSAIIPEEANYILNPLHPEFARLRFGAGSVFTLDPRLG
jgi:RES domain-containing protein